MSRLSIIQVYNAIVFFRIAKNKTSVFCWVKAVCHETWNQELGNKTALCCFRPDDRNLRDADLIAHRLRRVEALGRLPDRILKELALVGYYEDLEKGVTCEYKFVHGALRYIWKDVVNGNVFLKINANFVSPIGLCVVVNWRNFDINF